jgi:HlyD family type I secretion membrane fusion protein
MDELISRTKISKIHSVSHLLMSERLAESGSPKIIISSILVLTFVIVILLVWAGFTNIDEITSGVGEIVPSEHIVPVQHVEGGIVYKVFVKDGDIVKKGDPLFQLNPEPDTSDLKRLKKRQNALEIEIYRIQALLNNKAVTEDDLMSAITYKDVTEPSLLKLQLSNADMYQTQEMQEREYNRTELASRLEQEKINLKNVEEQIYHLNERKTVLEDQVKMYSSLNDQKAISRVDLLNVKERLQEVIGTLLTVVKDRTTIATTVLDLENKLKTLEFDKANQALKLLNDDTSQLLEVREQIARAQVAVDRLLVTSEIDGIVKGLTLHPGDVVAAAAELFQIVPITSKLYAEIKVSTTDVGHVKIGDEVQVKVGTYDFATYGAIQGTLSSISASTFLDPDKKPYYRCEVSLATNYLGGDPEKNKVFPGMTVTADIKTSKKSLLQYMLKPINKTFHEAFRER